MSVETERQRRVGELVRRELAMLIQREIDDPIIHGVTLTTVRMSRDLKNATVFFTGLTDDASPQSRQEHLNKAAGFLRHRLGDKVNLRSIPSLRFQYDESVERGSRLSRLIDSLDTGSES